MALIELRSGPSNAADRFQPNRLATIGLSASAERKAISATQFWLSLRVQLDAFRTNPLGYLQAVGWRLRGLRLRARHKMAALAGRSPYAYDLWIAKHELGLRTAFQALGGDTSTPILIAIDCCGDMGGIGRTLESIERQSDRALQVAVGRLAPAGLTSVERPGLLAKDLGADAGWLCILKPGDQLADGALLAYRSAIQQAPEARLIYADDDLIGEGGRRCSPHFKPAWNAELYNHHDFVSGSAILKVTSDDLGSVQGVNWAKELARKALQRTQPIHLPLVLHHRRKRAEPILPTVTAETVCDPLPSVTVIIPTRNQCALLQTCISGVQGTDYPDLQAVVIDNDSDDPATLAYLDELELRGVRVMRIPGPFNFSALNNAAVREIGTDILCFLNNDVEMIRFDWLRPLVAQAVRGDIGAVGAQLLYSDGTIQHAGVVTGLGGGAGHAHRFQKPEDAGYFRRASLPQLVSAVTAACLVVEREKFLSVGGFDEIDFPVAFNDVDLCLKLNERGWQSFYEPRSVLVHHESKSRGSDSSRINRDRFAGELAALKRKWGTDLTCDPFHHPYLSPFSEQFCVAV